MLFKVFTVPIFQFVFRIKVFGQRIEPVGEAHVSLSFGLFRYRGLDDRLSQIAGGCGHFLDYRATRSLLHAGLQLARKTVDLQAVRVGFAQPIKVDVAVKLLKRPGRAHAVGDAAQERKIFNRQIRQRGKGRHAPTLGSAAAGLCRIGRGQGRGVSCLKVQLSHAVPSAFWVDEAKSTAMFRS